MVFLTCAFRRTVRRGARSISLVVDFAEKCLVSDPSEVQRRYKEFLDLLPLTLSLAGLPESDHGRYFTEEQIETRVFAIRHAWKASRALVRDLVTK
jgi:hypothetical protein